MPGTFRVDAAEYKGEKPNPHGGVLHKFKVSLTGESGDPYHDVYWQRKSRELEVGEKVYGHIEQGEYGPRFKTDQRPDGGSPSSSGTLSKDDYWRRKAERDVESQARMGRAHAQEMALRLLTKWANPSLENGTEDLEAEVIAWTDWFHKDVQRFPLDADVGSGQAGHGASDNHPPVAEDAADLSAEADVGGGGAKGESGGLGPPVSTADVSAEASRSQKGELTKLFHKAGLSRDAMKAVVLFRCGAEKATKQGAQQLITDLQEGATHDALLAEIYDAKRAGNPLGARAAALIPSETPWDGEGLPPAKDITT